MGTALGREGGGGRVFVDFDPPYESIQKEEEDIFLVHLTGFEKEQLTVQVKRNRKVAISGERPLPDHRWSRFHKEFPVPAHCNTQEIAAKFEGGLLYLVLPKSPPQIPNREQQHPPPQIPNREQQHPPPQIPNREQQHPPPQIPNLEQQHPPPQIPNREQQYPPPQIPNHKQHHPPPPPPLTRPQTTPSSAHGGKNEKPLKQSDEERKTKEEPIQKDYHYDQPLKQSDEEKKTKEEPIKKDYYDRLKDPKDGGYIGDLQRGKGQDGGRIELGNLKLKMGNLECELHRTKHLVMGFAVVIVVILGIGFYMHYKLISSSTQGARQPL